MNWIREAWEFLFGWPAVSILIGCAATAVAVLEPKFLDAVTDLRKWAICVAVVAFSFIAISGKYFNDGIAVKQGEWDAALAAQVVAGEEDRDAAVAAEPVDPSDRSVFADDVYNRDRDGKPGVKPQSKVRWLTSHHLFGKW